MFVRMIPDNKGNRPGYYCSLVESKRIAGKTAPSHSVLYNFGFLDSIHAIYLKAALSDKDPESVVKTELAKKKDFLSLNNS